MIDARERKQAMKVAAVARRLGISVRTLHYYEEVGLLRPSQRTRSGHRLYGLKDLERLQQIKSLQQLGMRLADIQACLARGTIDAQRVVSDHLERVRAQRHSLDRLESQLSALATLLDRGNHDDHETIEAFLSAVEAITMYEQYFNPQQLERLKDHQATGEETVSPVIVALEKAMKSGVNPDSDEAKTLLSRFHEALEAVSQGDESMVDAISKLLHNEVEARKAHGISDELFAYMGRIAGGKEHSS